MPEQKLNSEQKAETLDSSSPNSTNTNVSGLPLSNDETDAELTRKFFHFIGDSIVLLGADTGFVSMIKELEYGQITTQTIEEIKRFNCRQIDAVKTRLALCNTIPVVVG